MKATNAATGLRPADWKSTVRSRFEAATVTYDAEGTVQQQIAEALSETLRSALQARLTQRDHPLSVLEVGCGTGFLTASLLPFLPSGSHWIATDLAPGMVSACLQRFLARTAPDIRHLSLVGKVMDGENPDIDRPVDLVVSSMAVQWFTDLPAGLKRLHDHLAPGGLLAVTTLGSDTFSEWRAACHATGVLPATPPYPTVGTLRAALGPEATVVRHRYPLPFDRAEGFLRHLRKTGARTAAPDHPPLSAGQLRRVLRSLSGQRFDTAYDVLTVLWPKGS